MEKVYEINTEREYEDAKKRFSFDLDMHALRYPFYIRTEGNHYRGWTENPDYYKNKMNLIIELYSFLKDKKVDSIHGLDLPIYFTIKTDQKHPRWNDYIYWLNITTGSNNEGNENGYYGIHLNGDSYNEKCELRGEQEITVDDWWVAINKSSRKITPPVYSVNLADMQNDPMKLNNNLMNSYLDQQRKALEGYSVKYTLAGPSVAVGPDTGTAVQSLKDSISQVDVEKGINVLKSYGNSIGQAPVKKENRYAKMIGLI